MVSMVQNGKMATSFNVGEKGVGSNLVVIVIIVDVINQLMLYNGNCNAKNGSKREMNDESAK